MRRDSAIAGICLSVLIFLLLPSSVSSQMMELDCCCGDVIEIAVPGGNFEFDPLPPNGGYFEIPAPGPLGPWTVTGGSVSHHDDDTGNLGAGNPNPSVAHVDLNGFNQGGICQTLTGFTIGQEYQLQFYYAIHNLISLGTTLITIDNGNALSVILDATNLGNVLWLEANYVFTATNSSMDLCFESLTTVQCCGMLIDDVKLFTCPVDAAPPAFTSVVNDEVYACFGDVPPAADIQATDDCSTTVPVTFDEEITVNGPCDYTIVRTWTAEDECANTTTLSQTIDVLDTEAPQLVNPPADVTLACPEDLPPPPNVTAVDNCTTNPSVSFEENQVIVSSCRIEVARTWTTTDDCGWTATHTQNLIIEDNIKPTVVIPPEDAFIGCDEDVEAWFYDWVAGFGGGFVEDNCGGIVTSSTNTPPPTNTCGVTLVEFLFTDACGNTTIEAAFFHVTDFTDPVFDTLPSDLTIPCGGNAQLLIDAWLDAGGHASAGDACGASVTHDFGGDYAGDQVVVYTATDLCANTTTAAASIHFVQTIDTVWTATTTCDSTATGIFETYIDSPTGCDSLLVETVVYAASDTSRKQIVVCDPEIVTTDTIWYINRLGCDSLVITSMLPRYSDSTRQFLYTCDAGLAGTDTLFLTNRFLCDSFVYVEHLYVPADTVRLFANTCVAEEAGLDTVFLMNRRQCDSIVVTATTYVQNDTVFAFEPMCDLLQDSVVVTTLAGTECDTVLLTTFQPASGDTMVTEQWTCRPSEVGSDTLRLTNRFLCDSLVIVHTRLSPPDTIRLDLLSCRLAEVGTDTSVFVVNDCDSIVITTVAYIPPDTARYWLTTCKATEAGLDTVFHAGPDCDSIFITETVFIPANEEQRFVKVCETTVPPNDTLFLQNTAGCDSLVITSYYNEALAFDFNLIYTPCAANPMGEIRFHSLVGSIVGYSIDGLNFSKIETFSGLTAGTYTMAVMDADGCISEISTAVVPEYVPINISSPAEVTIVPGLDQSLSITFLPEPDTFYWSIPEILSCLLCPDPVVTTDRDTVLTIYALNADGCLFEKDIRLKVEAGGDVFWPNILSPNGDGYNDEFRFSSTQAGLRISSFLVYDRWGNLVFHSTEERGIHEATWDGKFNGEFVPPGVYVFIAEVADTDGEIRYLAGDVAVVR